MRVGRYKYGADVLCAVSCGLCWSACTAACGRVFGEQNSGEESRRELFFDFQNVPMESVLTRTVVERRGSLSPPQSPDHDVAPINIPDSKGDFKMSR